MCKFFFFKSQNMCGTWYLPYTMPVWFPRVSEPLVPTFHTLTVPSRDADTIRVPLADHPQSKFFKWVIYEYTPSCQIPYQIHCSCGLSMSSPRYHSQHSWNSLDLWLQSSHTKMILYHTTKFLSLPAVTIWSPAGEKQQPRIRALCPCCCWALRAVF